jgi:hypothetical protein
VPSGEPCRAPTLASERDVLSTAVGGPAVGTLDRTLFGAERGKGGGRRRGEVCHSLAGWADDQH